jgi:hypothetical protein
MQRARRREQKEKYTAMKSKRQRHLTLLLALLLITFGGSLMAQTVPSGAAPGEEKQQEKGMVAYESFEGSSNSDGQVMDLNSTLGYNFNKYFGVDVGVPIYFVRAATTTSTSGQRSANGLGNFYTDLRLNLRNPLVNYTTTITGSAPTGDTSMGLSNGRATVNWNNHFDRDIARLTPFLNIGVGNTVQDTRLFKRPFITLGKVANFELGTDIDIWKSLSFTASAYDLQPWGQQRVFSRVRRSGSASGGASPRGRVFENAAETVGSADLVRDHGFSAGLSFNPLPHTSVDAGYTRSVRFGLDTISFGVGFDLSPLFRHHGRP